MVVILKWSHWHLGEGLRGEATVLSFMIEADHRKPQPTHISTSSYSYVRPVIVNASWLVCELSRVRQVSEYRQWGWWRRTQGSDICLPWRRASTCQSPHTAWWWLNAVMPMRGWSLNYLLSAISYEIQFRVHGSKWWRNSRKLWFFFFY